MESVLVEAIMTLSASQIADLRLASQSLTRAARRAFQAEMTLKYCDGKARLAEKVFGWGRHMVVLGLAEKRTGLICVGSQSGFSGTNRWEDRYLAADVAWSQVHRHYRIISALRPAIVSRIMPESAPRPKPRCCGCSTLPSRLSWSVFGCTCCGKS